MAKKKAKVVTAPSGVTVTRSGNNYTVKWKRGTTYAAQSLGYQRTGAKRYNASVAAGATSKVLTFNKNGYYPKTKIKVNKFTFWIKGATGSGKKRRWSKEAKKEFQLWKPIKPVLTTSHSSEPENSTSFNYYLDWTGRNLNKTATGAIFTNFQWWTSLLPNSDLDSDKVTTWQETGINADDADNITKTITETEVFSGDYSYTRYFKVVARGPCGDSVPSYAKHVYAIPNAPRNVKANAVPLENGSGYRVSAQWTVDVSKSRPVDEVYLEYAIEKPDSTHVDVNGTRKITLSVPSIDSWTTVSTLKDASNQNGAVDGTAFIIDRQIPEDSWIFVRVVTKYDNRTSPSETVFVDGGNGLVKSPTGLSATISGNIASVTVNDTSEVSESIVGIYYRSDKDTTPRLVGIKPAGTSYAISVQLPNTDGASSISLGAKAFVADYTPITPSASGVTAYALSNIRMESNGIVWDERAVPKPPSNIGLSSPRTGVVRITWDWSWTDANGVELSWSDHDDAWESTDEPTTYTIENQRASAWNICGLGIGTWYFRIRLYKTDEDAVTYGTYSNIHSIKLASSPATPVLTITPSIVAPDGNITCYWAFTATDGDEQVQADICEATMNDDGSVQYGQIVARADNEQFKTLNIKDLGWAAGSKHFLATRIVTASGEESNNWSVPKPVQILNPISASIDSTSLEVITVVDDEEQSITRQQLSLTEMPLDVTASGAGEGGTITYILERSGDYPLDRPDENELIGFDGETVALIQKSADNDGGEPADYSISIGLEDLIGRLDDGAYYNLIAVVQDSYGQSAQAQLEFAVHWDHQAVVPSANITVDNEAMIAIITPVQPETGYAEGDVCDIYRISVDKPELIVENAEFGTQYVDPYPALGDQGGHRIVYKTIYGDYITADNEFAWTDYDYEEGDIVDRFATVIDFGDDQAVLPYDLSLSSKWNKDFTQTKYLGGAIEGDWNPTVERTTSVRTRVAVKQDSELVEIMRRLAVYSGVCHVRTPDGSSFAANVDVSEDREEKMINKIASFSLDITRVDATGFDGMTYAEWIKNN